MYEEHAFLAFVPSRATTALPRASQITLGEHRWVPVGDPSGQAGECAVLRAEMSINGIRCGVYLVEVLGPPSAQMCLVAQCPPFLQLPASLRRSDAHLQRVAGRNYVMVVVVIG